MLCVWCHQPFNNPARGDPVYVDHMPFHLDCAKQYQAWCQELKCVLDTEIAKNKKEMN